MLEIDPQTFSSETAHRIRERVVAHLARICKEQGKAPASRWEIEAQCARSTPHGLATGHIRAEFILNLMRLQWPGYIKLENGPFENTFAKEFIKRLCQYRVVNALGCASCVSGDTRLFDPLTRKTHPVSDFHERGEHPLVMSLYGPRIASVPFVKGVDTLYEVILSDASRFRCTAKHRLLTAKGYRELHELCEGDEILSYDSIPLRSTLDISLSSPPPNGLGSPKKAGGYLENYSTCSHLYGERPLLSQGIGQSSFPSRVGALGYRECISSHWDVPDNGFHGIHPSLLSRLPSTDFQRVRSCLQGISSSLHFCEATPKPLGRSFQSSSQSQPDKLPRLPFSGPALDSLHSDSPCNFYDREQIEHSWGIRVSPKVVVSIRESHEEVFYDLMVPDAHHYFAEGAIHHNSGKSTIAAAYCDTMWKLAPWETSIFLSTTTGDAGQSRSWGIVKDLHKNDRYKVGGVIEYLSTITLNASGGTEERDYRDSLKAVLIPKGSDGDNAIAAIVGRHNKKVIWCADELPFMPAGVLTGRLNVLANLFGQFIGLGNKPKEGDPLYLDAEPLLGWESVDPDTTLGWETKAGWCVYMDGERSPNMEQERGKEPPFPGMMDWTMRDLIEKDSGGPDSPGYWHQVRGFPAAGARNDTVLTRELIVNNRADLEPVWSGGRRIVLAGLDLGFRADGDPCVIAFGGIGQNDQGLMILGLEPETIRVTVKVGIGEPFEMQVAKFVVEQCKKRGCHDLELDVSGEGGIFSQAIEAEARRADWQLTVYPTSFMGLPDENERFHHGGQMRPARELFDRKVTQLWMSFRRSVMNGCVRGLKPDSQAGKELRIRRQAMDDKKKMALERKRDLKKRLKHSCDAGDATILCHSLALKKGLPRDPQNVRGLNPERPLVTPLKDEHRAYAQHQQRALYAGR